jgi:hypothetical protein
VAAFVLLSVVATPALSAQQAAGAQAVSRAEPLPDARDVVARHIEAVGGRDALARLHSRHVWAHFEVPGERVKGQLQIFAARPNRLLIKTTFSDLATTVTGFDGQMGWSETPGSKPALVRGRQLVQLRDEADFDIDLREGPAYRSIETVGRVEFGERTCYRLKVVRASSRELAEFYDVASGLYAGSVARRETDKGPVTVTTIVHRYKAFDGVKVPVQITITSAGVEQVIKVMTVKHNDVRPSVFAPPQRLRSEATQSPSGG